MIFAYDTMNDYLSRFLIVIIGKKILPDLILEMFIANLHYTKSKHVLTSSVRFHKYWQLCNKVPTKEPQKES